MKKGLAQVTAANPGFLLAAEVVLIGAGAGLLLRVVL